ncbi:MAG: HD domain-containing protein [Crocinitomicaceae bacterium]
MSSTTVNKLKIINDPVHGFITIQNELIYDLIEHPYFQRLRRIKQLGLSHLVYPGANHTRFHHAIGAMHLMSKALFSLVKKGVEITGEEQNAALIAILLHDIGHGPFSHTLEHTILKSIHHESVSILFMNRLNEEFDGKLKLAIDIFSNNYSKKFLHQLVSSQLDMDRLDYLQRDSFFTGVSEGIIGSERIIKMLDVRDNELVITEKGIYSIENFISARRIMYWQVYMHKTVVASEYMLRNTLRRAKELFMNGENLFAPPSLKVFLENNFSNSDFEKNPDLLLHFANIDDSDIIVSIKVWQSHSDKILSELSRRIIARHLFKTEISKTPFSKERLNEEKERLKTKHQINDLDVGYFLISQKLSNSAYTENFMQIKIIDRYGNITELSKASDNYNIAALSSPVEKYFICFDS